MGKALMLAAFVALSSGDGAAQELAANDYGDMANWLCRPARADACVVDQTATRVGANGSLTVEPFDADPDAPVDCFYVYPTVSRDAAPMADMIPGPGETGVVRSQFARFGSVCRLYAPMYRQVSLAGLRAALSGGADRLDGRRGFLDVVDAWNHYLTHDNNGRGVILIGHSQGTDMLVRLIAAEIDGKPVQDRIVSALLIGNNMEVPEGRTVGGSFAHFPLCTSASQTGCAVSYMAFRKTLPPVQSFFGIARRPGMVAACTNPASLRGGSGELDAYFGGGGGVGNQFAWTTSGPQVETSFARVTGMLTAECVQNGRYSYLEVTVHGDPDDARADDIPGDLLIAGEPSAQWGLHLVDMHLAMGNLLAIVRDQTTAYLNR